MKLIAFTSILFVTVVAVAAFGHERVYGAGYELGYGGDHGGGASLSVGGHISNTVNNGVKAANTINSANGAGFNGPAKAVLNVAGNIANTVNGGIETGNTVNTAVAVGIGEAVNAGLNVGGSVANTVKDGVDAGNTVNKAVGGVIVTAIAGGHECNLEGGVHSVAKPEVEVKIVQHEVGHNANNINKGVEAGFAGSVGSDWKLGEYIENGVKTRVGSGVAGGLGGNLGGSLGGSLGSDYNFNGGVSSVERPKVEVTAVHHEAGHNVNTINNVVGGVQAGGSGGFNAHGYISNTINQGVNVGVGCNLGGCGGSAASVPKPKVGVKTVKPQVKITAVKPTNVHYEDTYVDVASNKRVEAGFGGNVGVAGGFGTGFGVGI